MRRWGAIYAFAFARRDARAIDPLIAVLRNPEESVKVRGLAAECLSYTGNYRSVPALIESSRDPSPDIRFWCVFALGFFRRHLHHKARSPAIHALMARLNDHAYPEASMHWTVALEALAMLASNNSRSPENELISATCAPP